MSRAALPGPRYGTPALAALAEVLHRWRWRHTLLGVVIGLLHIVLGPGGSLLLWPVEADKHYPSALLHYILLFGLPLTLAVRLADHAVDRGASPWWAYGLAVLSVAVLGSWGGWALQLSIWAGARSTQARNAWLALGVAMLQALAVAAYAQGRQAWQTLARLRGAELERARQLQQLQLQGLLALQARVDPQLLFNALRRIQDLSRHDAHAADALLADLCELLRALLPGPEAGLLSTLGRECALLQAYARVSAGLGLRVELADRAASATVAPMLLLPMLRALESAVGPGQDFVLSAEPSGPLLQIRLATDAPAAAAPRLQALHERVAGLYAQAGRLRQLPGPGTALALELPLHAS